MKHIALVLTSLLLLARTARPTPSSPFYFSTGAPNGLMGSASRPAGAGAAIESADDFRLRPCPVVIDQATFFGVIPSGAPLSSISSVSVKIYRLFPADSNTTRTITVPTRTNSPSDGAFATRASVPPAPAVVGPLRFTAAVINPSFTVANSVLSGIFPSPNQTTGGEGPVTGEEIKVEVAMDDIDLPAGHYFFVPQVGLISGDFYWLSAATPPQFVDDEQSWIRDPNLAPDWLRIGTDIVGGGAAFNGAFSLQGHMTWLIVQGPSSGLPESQYETEGRPIMPVQFWAGRGTGVYTFSASGRLPSGVTLSPNGMLSGTPAESGWFEIFVSASDSAGCSSNAPWRHTILVAAAPLSAAGVAFTFTAGTQFTGTVATFSDANTAAQASAFTAIIEWGDGTSSPGTIADIGNGNFTVAGTHTYATPGPVTATVTIRETDGNNVTTTATGNVLAIPTLAGSILALLALAMVLVASRSLGAS